MRLPFGRRRMAGTDAADLPERNEYYENISANLGIFQVILYLSLFAFVILSFAKNTGLITYKNFYHFFRDLNASVQTVDASHPDSLTYPTDDRQSITLFRQGVAVAGNKNVTLFTATGRQTVSQITSFANPVATASDKYLLVYDFGGKKYELYNSYTRIFSGESEEPILGASISDSGAYALITQSKRYVSVVHLYSNRFTLLGEYRKTGYVMDVSINERGNLLAILTSRSLGGFWTTELELFKPGEESPRANATLGDAIGLACSFTSGGKLAVLTEGAVLSLNEAGTIEAKYSLDGREIALFDIGAQGVTVSLASESVSQKNTLIVFDKNGKMLYNSDEPSVSEQIARTRDAVLLLTANGVGRISLENGIYSWYPCNTQNRRLLAIDSGEFILCSPQKAEYFEFDS